MYRLERVEREVAANTRETAAIRAMLGDRFNALMFELDHRYMPRDELAVVYIPRREHEQSRKDDRNLRLQVPLVVFAGLGWLTGLLEYLLNTHP